MKEMNTTMSLLRQLQSSSRKQKNQYSISARTSPIKQKISSEKAKAEEHYKYFTNLTKNEKLEEVRSNVKQRTAGWKHDYYRSSRSFNIVEKEGVDEFPHNNRKYNMQFLDKTLEGGGLHFTAKDWGFFTKPKDQLYSKHFMPIVKEKRKYNQDFMLRASMFGKTWVDQKRDKIIDEYTIQANPFSTAKSNDLICLIRPARKHRFS